MDSRTELEAPPNFVLRVIQFLFTLFAYPSILLRPRSKFLKPIEQSLFNLLAERLDKPLGAILQAQVAELNYVQRLHPRRTECNFYRFVPFRFDRARSARFPFTELEVVLCTVRFQTNVGTRQVVKVHVVRGNFFELEFGRDMRKHLNEVIAEVISFKQVGVSEG
jgi:hypothetical protein